MDNSREYILMCRKAFKDLGRPKPLGLTNLWHEKTKTDFASPFLLSNERSDKYFPIYRQDQLQEMMFSEESRIWRLHEWFDRWYPIGDRTDSFEKLWLAFVIKEKYQKNWTGTEWKHSL